ncbi:MAG: hypothetical protein F6K63_06905 [Moorea sp. SIO1G6]|uniref:EF-hand domain-containing protein n=1 Tax=Moorena sp. SIO1G6 TaxID=2607840 RepID=UPI0013C21813|nr:EF-hand domain-containing protein [Moorena sp. SIO1G6]NET64144.1 hypothetical protein [Moorena sp. SIO1G6]
MLTELQQKKLTTLFNNIDADSGGTLNQDDFHLILNKLASSRGLKPNSWQYAYLRSILVSMWNNLSLADQNSDAEITLEEWFKYYDNLIHSDAYEPLIQLQCDVFFALLDQDDNGEISQQEYVDLVSAYGVDPSWARENFGHLDLNSDGHISQEELFTLMDEFFRSDNPKSPGNYFWGSY